MFFKEFVLDEDFFTPPVFFHRVLIGSWENL